MGKPRYHRQQISDPENSSAVVTKSFHKPQTSFIPTKPLHGHRLPDTILMCFSHGKSLFRIPIPEPPL